MSGWFHGGWRDWLWLLLAALLFLIALITPMGAALASPLTQEEEKLIAACESGEVIRLHIVANSDSPQDQTIKLAVRDAVLESYGQMLSCSAQESSDAAFALLKACEPSLCLTARKAAQKLGFTGVVKSETGVLHLPERSYGNVTLREGDYRALRITLGSGQGKNWWCVLFPQLCLSLSADGNSSASLTWDSTRIFKNWLLKGI